MAATEPHAQVPPERAEFRATLTPNRSLGPRGFVVLMCGLAAVSFVTGVAFARVGAWPVLAFFGLDVAVIYLAFKLNYRAGRLYEQVQIAGGKLTVTRVEPNGRSARFVFPAYWARVRLIQDTDGRSRLSVASHGREVTFGAFLSHDERAGFADALRAALEAARRSPTT